MFLSPTITSTIAYAANTMVIVALVDGTMLVAIVPSIIFVLPNVAAIGIAIIVATKSTRPVAIIIVIIVAFGIGRGQGP